MAGMFDVKVKDFGLRERLKRLEKLSTANLTTGMERVGIRWLKFVDDGFKREMDPYGNPWLPLAARTVKKKKALGYKNPTAILQASGQMRKSWSYHATSRSVALQNNRASFPDGSDASSHQFGRNTGKFNIPSRPMVPFENDPPAEWMVAAHNVIRYAIGRYME